MTTEKVRSEARAKIIWGESRESVSAFLLTHGVGEKEALSLLADFDKERAAGIRSSGFKKVMTGVIFIPIPVIAYLTFMVLGVIYIKIFAITLVAGGFGLWKLIDGITMIVSPRSERGDLSNLAD